MRINTQTECPMRNLIYFFILMLGMSACSSIQVTSDYDKTVDFSRYKTFMYYGWTEESDKILSEFDRDRIESAFATEFSRRGWSLTKEDGDAVVSLFIVVDQKTSYTSYTDHYGGGMYGGMYGPRYGYGGYGGGYGYGMPSSSTTRTTQNDYLEGTLIVDVFDVKEKKHIWQGIGKKTLSESNSNREGRIKEAVAAIMKQFPVKPLPVKK